MPRLMLIAALIALNAFLIDCNNTESPLLIGSFNIQSLGPTKIARPEFVSAVVAILAKYDIIMIQEIKDISVNNTVFYKLIEELNKFVKIKEQQFSYVLSPRLGKTSYKEQFAYLYRNSNNEARQIKLVKHYIYDDINFVYERSPYIAKFSLRNSSFPFADFDMINLHLKPASVLNESMQLRDVINKIYTTDQTENIIIMGDMNFDCGYISAKNRAIVQSVLFEFDSFIADKVPTTIAAELCALDRIFIAGNQLKDLIVPASNKTYIYYEEFNKTLAEAKSISDHIPVEFQMKANN